MRLVIHATSGRSHSSMTAVIESLILFGGPEGWWGEAPDLPQRPSKAPVVVQPYSRKGRKSAEPRSSVWPGP
jgi:hypothetical protein